MTLIQIRDYCFPFPETTGSLSGVEVRLWLIPLEGAPVDYLLGSHTLSASLGPPGTVGSDHWPHLGKVAVAGSPSPLPNFIKPPKKKKNLNLTRYAP